jgi:hypothetical protein
MRRYFSFQPGSPTFTVLHLSDIHVDFAYKPGSQADCFQPLCCREGPPREYIMSSYNRSDCTFILSSWSYRCWLLVRTLNLFTAIVWFTCLGVTIEIATCPSGRLKLFFNMPPNWKRCRVKLYLFFLVNHHRCFSIRSDRFHLLHWRSTTT